LHLSNEIHGKKWSNRYKCHLEEGYGYSYSIVPKPLMTWRCLRDYEWVADLMNALWKRLWHHFDPPSQQCPPTAVNILYYFSAFKAHIRAHQDNAPNMSIPMEHNSQMLGSSVMVLSLLDEQELCFCALKNPTKSSQPKVLSSIRLGHLSVYILKCCDDFDMKHMTRFPSEQKKDYGAVRVSLVGRWLTRRCEAFCEDYKGVRRFQEKYENPNKVLRKMHKNKQCIKNWEVNKYQKFRPM
jgi:hypothetical protein